jgi:hypothetical protein
MKVLAVILTILLASYVGSTVFAQIVVEMNQNGEYRYAVSVDHWEREGVNVADEVKKYIEGTKKAIESPGEFIPVVNREVPKEMVSPFGLKSDLVTCMGVIYDQENREVVMVNDPTVLSSSVAFSPFLVWWAFSLVAVVLLNMRDERFEAPVFDVTVSVVGLLGFAFALLSVSPVIPILSTLLFFVSVVPLAIVVGRQERKEKRTMYWGASVTLYIIFVVLLAFVYGA